MQASYIKQLSEESRKLLQELVAHNPQLAQTLEDKLPTPHENPEGLKMLVKDGSMHVNT